MSAGTARITVEYDDGLRVETLLAHEVRVNDIIFHVSNEHEYAGSWGRADVAIGTRRFLDFRIEGELVGQVDLDGEMCRVTRTER